VELFLAGNLIEFHSDQIRFSPLYAPRKDILKEISDENYNQNGPLADVLMFTGPQETSAEFSLW
jgi:hypothetical protein